MPTVKQRKVARLLLNNMTLDKPLNAGAMLEKVGYSKSIATARPKAILESVGVRNALAEYGLTEELITTALVEDINNKKHKRLGELRLGAEILGLNEPEDKKTSGPVTINVLNFNNSGDNNTPQV